MENNCEDVVDVLGSLDDLSPEDRALVAAHLGICPNCRAMDLGLRAIPALVRAGLDSSLDDRSSSAVARQALDALIATADDRLRKTLLESLE
jgi:hypothetical protein